ncbi:MAG: WG repeat-containing protein [Ferruginibacter sp.]
MDIKKILVGCFMMMASGTFAQQTDMSLIPYRQGDKWGYANPDRKVVIAPRYSEANWFSEGYASVKIGNKYGYINKTGTLVIPARYTVAKSFRRGYMPNPKKEGGDSVLFAGASLVASGEEICINTRGIRMPQCPAINENSVLENRLPLKTVEVEKTYSIPNNNGLFDKIVDDYKITGSDETYYIAMKNSQYGVFNSKFDTIIPFQYNSIKVNRKSAVPFLQVNKGGMYGVMTTDGRTSIAPEYSNLAIVDGQGGKEYVIIQKGGKTYVKDITNRDIISTGYSDIVYDNGGFIITGDNDMRGYYFMDNSVIQPKYKDVKWVNGTKYLMIKTSTGKVGYINTAGDEYFVE